jgi:hypothetical protein
MYKGNPRTIQFLGSDGETFAKLSLFSAALRREVTKDDKFRIVGVSAITVAEGSSSLTWEVARLIAELFDMEVVERQEPLSGDDGDTGFVEYWFADLPGEKVLWTHYHTHNGLEIGPRMKIFQIKRE